jgi:hypothetical protein
MLILFSAPRRIARRTETSQSNTVASRIAARIKSGMRRSYTHQQLLVDIRQVVDSQFVISSKGLSFSGSS